jgi:hypothetical protein
MLKGWHLDATVYEEGPSYDRPSYSIPSYHDDGQIRQFRRREREKLDVPKRLVGIGEVDLYFFRCTGSLRIHLSLVLPYP